MQPETAEEFYARVLAHADSDGRLPLGGEPMAAWDVFPYEMDTLRVKAIKPLADAEPPRKHETEEECWCTASELPTWAADIVWRNERWVLTLDQGTLPVGLTFMPLQHCDLATVPDELAAEMGRLIVTIAAAVEELPSVARAHVMRYGDGSAHLHVFVAGRPARALQFRGSPLLEWSEWLPTVPLDVLRANAEFVGARLTEAHGGEGPIWS